jgi:DNA repair exonuclease SbcCD ATPase subunit
MKGVFYMEQKKHPHVSRKMGEYPLFFKHDVLEELRLAEHAQEEAYFHKVNQALLAALRQQDTTKLEQTRQQYEQRRCPHCGKPLQETSYHHVQVQECPSCHGSWLDHDTLHQSKASKEGNWLQRLFEVFLLADV